MSSPDAYGKQEGKLDVARTMLENGIDHNAVMKMTGLSEDDIAQAHTDPFLRLPVWPSVNTGGTGKHHSQVQPASLSG